MHCECSNRWNYALSFRSCGPTDRSWSEEQWRKRSSLFSTMVWTKVSFHNTYTFVGITKFPTYDCGWKHYQRSTSFPYHSTEYLEGNTPSPKYLSSSVMSVSCLPPLAGIRDSRETFLELDFCRTVTHNYINIGPFWYRTPLSNTRPYQLS